MGNDAGSIQLADFGLGPYVHETPSERFPIYTRGNAGEVWPNVVYPLTLSLTRDYKDPLGAAILGTGMVEPEEFAKSVTSAGGCFGGYMYLNLSLVRVLAVRSPGVTIEENDRVYLGSEGTAPPHRPDPRDKSIKASFNALRYVAGILRSKKVEGLDENIALVRKAERDLPGWLELDDHALSQKMRELNPMVMDMFGHHLQVTGKAGAALQVLSGACESNLGDSSIALELLSGLGDVSSAAPSTALWDLGRMVDGDTALTSLFDAGLRGLHDRLQASGDAASFNQAFERFQDDFGSRGPNEWDAAAETWGTDPALPLALIDRMRGAEPDKSPADRGRALAAAREEAVGQARAKVKPLGRGLFDRMVKVASMYSVGRERSKTTVVELIHVLRIMSRELGRRVATRNPGGGLDDMWFLLSDDLEPWIDKPEQFADVIASRRATRDELSKRVPPFVFEGEMPPVDTWELREDVGKNAEALGAGDSITGLPAVAGVAEGRAVVVTDPAEPGDLGPGDVLIAPLTDPAWTPLFVPVEAVVVDVGGQMSHAVIVAREFGMPCVVAATGATTTIPNGARVRVDGSAGTVTVL